jgi:methionine-rich copper-binding protein CopC
MRVPFDGNAQIKIWDGLGRLVAQTIETKVMTGTSTMELPLENLAQGLYRVDVRVIPEDMRRHKVQHANLPFEIKP